MRRRTYQRRSGRAQTMVEFAVLLPVMITVFFGAIAIDSYIQAQSLLQQASNEAALTIARNSNDSCANGDTGYAQAIAAFDSALKSPLYTTPYPTPAITCAAALSSASCTISTAGANTCTGIPASCTGDGYGGAGGDGGCFGIWRGGVVGVDVKATITLSWIPLWNHATVRAVSAEALEPFRSHTCPSTGVPIDYC